MAKMKLGHRQEVENILKSAPYAISQDVLKTFDRFGPLTVKMFKQVAYEFNLPMSSFCNDKIVVGTKRAYFGSILGQFCKHTGEEFGITRCSIGASIVESF